MGKQSTRENKTIYRFAEKRQDLQEQRPVKKMVLSLIQKLKNLNMKHKEPTPYDILQNGRCL